MSPIPSQLRLFPNMCQANLPVHCAHPVHDVLKRLAVIHIITVHDPAVVCNQLYVQNGLNLMRILRVPLAARQHTNEADPEKLLIHSGQQSHTQHTMCSRPIKSSVANGSRSFTSTSSWRRRHRVAKASSYSNFESEAPLPGCQPPLAWCSLME